MPNTPVLLKQKFVKSYKPTPLTPRSNNNPRIGFHNNSCSSVSSIDTVSSAASSGEHSKDHTSISIRDWRTSKTLEKSHLPKHPRRLYERAISFGTDNTDSSPFIASSDEDTPRQQKENIPLNTNNHTLTHCLSIVAKKKLRMSPKNEKNSINFLKCKSAKIIQTMWRRNHEKRKSFLRSVTKHRTSSTQIEEKYTPLQEWKGQQTAIDKILKRLQEKNMLTPTQANNIAASHGQVNRQTPNIPTSSDKKRRNSDEKFVSAIVEQACLTTSIISPSTGTNNFSKNVLGKSCNRFDKMTSAVTQTPFSESSNGNHRSYITNIDNASTSYIHPTVHSMLRKNVINANKLILNKTIMSDVSDIQIISYERVNNDHIEYRIGVKCNDGKSFVSNTTRRFREFVDLDRIIKLDLTRWQRNQLPKLPSKTFFPCTEEKFVIKRMKKLQLYLKKLSNIKYVTNTQAFKFFITQKNRKIDLTKTPTCFSWLAGFDPTYEKMPLGWV